VGCDEEAIRASGTNRRPVAKKEKEDECGGQESNSRRHSQALGRRQSRQSPSGKTCHENYQEASSEEGREKSKKVCGQKDCTGWLNGSQSSCWLKNHSRKFTSMVAATVTGLPSF
jgi:hypothetical protein